MVLDDQHESEKCAERGVEILNDGMPVILAIKTLGIVERWRGSIMDIQ
jgi:hypothetical protein